MTVKRTNDKISNLKTAISPIFHMEADGGGGILSLLISGTVGIAEFSSEEVKLITKNESIRIVGENIKLTVFERNTVEISGRIFNINFLAKKGKRNGNR